MSPGIIIAGNVHHIFVDNNFDIVKIISTIGNIEKSYTISYSGIKSAKIMPIIKTRYFLS